MGARREEGGGFRPFRGSPSPSPCPSSSRLEGRNQECVCVCVAEFFRVHRIDDERGKGRGGAVM